MCPRTDSYNGSAHCSLSAAMAPQVSAHEVALRGISTPGLSKQLEKPLLLIRRKSKNLRRLEPSWLCEQQPLLSARSPSLHPETPHSGRVILTLACVWTSIYSGQLLLLQGLSNDRIKLVKGTLPWMSSRNWGVSVVLCFSNITWVPEDKPMRLL